MIGLPGVRRIATTMAATACAAVLVCCAQSSSAQESLVAPPSAADIPARFSRQVAPNPGTYWRPPDLRDYTRVLKSGFRYGDSAPMAVIEFVDRDTNERGKDSGPTMKTEAAAEAPAA